MAYFQLIFLKNAAGERHEIRDIGSGEPTIDGQHIVDGGTVAIYGSLWRVARVDAGFVVSPADTAPEIRSRAARRAPGYLTPGPLG